MRKVAEHLYFIETSGSDKEVGDQFGQAFFREIESTARNSVHILEKRFQTEQITQAIDVISKRFRKRYPYLWEEMNGICEGAQLSSETFRMHIFQPAIGLMIDDGGCTDIIFPDSETGPLLGKTHDTTRPDLEDMVIRLIRSDHEYDVLCVTRMNGISAMTGLNERGLGVGESSIHFCKTNPHGTVRNLLIRPLLHECADVKEAIDFLQDHPPSNAGFNFALVDDQGNAVIVERAPTEQVIRRSKGEALFCTNHTATPSLRIKEKSRGKAGDRNSDERYDTLNMLTHGRDFSPSLDSMKGMLTYHDDKGSICQHGDPDYQGRKETFYPLFTQRAFINIVKAGILLVSKGPPCRTDFLEFALDGE